MSEFEDKLNALLANPAALEQVMNLARSFGSGTDSDNTAAPSSPTESPSTASSSAPPPSSSSADNGINLSSLLGGLTGENGFDPATLSMLAGLFQEYNSTDSRQVALFTSLKPFLKSERHAKIDKALKLAKLSRVIRVVFQGLKGGDQNV